MVRRLKQGTHSALLDAILPLLPCLPLHHVRIPARRISSSSLPECGQRRERERRNMTHEMMPPTANTIPNRLPSLSCFPLCIQPIRITEQVLKCPTTVLLTGPASLIIANWDKLIRQARPPLYNAKHPPSLAIKGSFFQTSTEEIKKERNSPQKSTPNSPSPSPSTP